MIQYTKFLLLIAVLSRIGAPTPLWIKQVSPVLQGPVAHPLPPLVIIVSFVLRIPQGFFSMGCYDPIVSTVAKYAQNFSNLCLMALCRGK